MTAAQNEIAMTFSFFSSSTNIFTSKLFMTISANRVYCSPIIMEKKQPMSNKKNDQPLLTNALTHEQLKQLFVNKVTAIEKKDFVFLDDLRKQHPELFDKKFLYELLLKELEIKGYDMPNHLQQVLLDAIGREPSKH